VNSSAIANATAADGNAEKYARPTTDRLPGLDVLRALAILLVIEAHLRSWAFPWIRPLATWSGVDLFFLLSGYLIGSQVLRPYANRAQHSFLDFYLRRAFRILPAYFFVLGLYFTIPILRGAERLSPLWKYLTFTLNLGLDAQKTNAFADVWSLCVEEHFYLCLPIVVYYLMRRPNLRKVVILAVGTVVLGIALRSLLWIRYVRPLNVPGLRPRMVFEFLKVIYVPTYNRLDGLLIGVLLAATQIFRPVWWSKITHNPNLLLAGGALLTVFSLWFFWDTVSFATSAVAFPFLVTGYGLLVLSSLSNESLLSKYRVAGAATVAKLAYSAYLTHQIVILFVRDRLGQILPLTGFLGIVLYYVSIFVVASALYVVVERPFLLLRCRILGRNSAGSTSGNTH
jgi:peptidoglycan/LPS O-acetylase OafA/YrhL